MLTIAGTLNKKSYISDSPMLHSLLGADSKRRTDDYDGTCDTETTHNSLISPALPTIMPFGYKAAHDAGISKSFQMRMDDGKTVWATPLSRPPGAPNVTHLHGLLSGLPLCVFVQCYAL
jgi:hypothetical protein